MRENIKNKRQKGSLTVEAAIVLVLFIFGYASIISITSFIRAQMIIQYSITQAAKEISSYCYIVSKTGIMDDSGRIHKESETFKNDTDKVIDTVVKLYEAIDDGAENISNAVHAVPENQDLVEAYESVKNVGSVTQEEYNNILAAANTMAETGDAYFSDPKNILKGMVSLAKDTGLSAAKTYLIAAPISKAMVKKQIELYGTTSKGEDVLEHLGVVNGMNGLNFSGCTLFNDGETITVQVSYTMKVNYPYFEQKEFHFVQTASTRAWGAQAGERKWRK